MLCHDDQSNIVPVEHRKVTYRLYPSKTQAAALLHLLRLHQQLYNAALDQRITAWRRRRVSLSYADQCRELTDLRRECPEFATANCSSQQRTLRRLDIAFQAFFRRVKERGERAGFPRFKSLHAFPGFGFKSHGDGWRFVPGADGKHGKLRLQGVGVVKARGQARTGGTIKACEVLHRDGVWSLSLTVECQPIRAGGIAACGLDWGVSDFATLALTDGTHRSIANPRLGQQAERGIRIAARAVARKKRGSNNRRKAARHLRRLRQRLANRRRDFAHQRSAELAGRFALIATEELNVKNMTATACGTADAPGRNVRAKAGLNREILDTAPAAFLALLRYKATEAGSEIVEVPTRTLKPSQRCPACLRVEKKTLSQRMHCCPCGHVEPRDAASGRVALNWVLGQMQSGREPTLRERAGVAPPAHETPSIPQDWMG
ncbi:RNA-guided endonuclease InsQ/TnpB family protein [Sabulicella rubraurantiaca]|uniref:RNA-guided endonuclease InsQ/TnpB family protein n=1 Tax=Sabulicella rubraurantiaca TaxID=2811429 RepID=UPI001A963785|nr:RNA-guided endonuclease TnpB family protein [Sabulicella rubraurantiaca]